MLTDPKPIRGISNDMCQHAVVVIGTRTPNLADFLKAKGWVAMVLAPEMVRFAGATLGLHR